MQPIQKQSLGFSGFPETINYGKEKQNNLAVVIAI